MMYTVWLDETSGAWMACADDPNTSFHGKTALEALQKLLDEEEK